MAKYVFISYSAKDEDTALGLVDYLKGCEIESWISCRNIPTGASYPVEIVQAIENCDCFVLVLSPDSRDSKHVMSELSTAFGEKKPIYPLQLKKTELDKELKYYLEFSQIKDISSSPESHFETISKEITAIFTGDESVIKKYRKPQLPAWKAAVFSVAAMVILAALGWVFYENKLSPEAVAQEKYNAEVAQLRVDVQNGSWNTAFDHLLEAEKLADNSGIAELKSDIVGRLAETVNGLPAGFSVEHEDALYSQLKQFAGYEIDRIEGILFAADFRSDIDAAEKCVQEGSWNDLFSVLDSARDNCVNSKSTELVHQYRGYAEDVIGMIISQISIENVHQFIQSRDVIEKISNTASEGNEQLKGISNLLNVVDYFECKNTLTGYRSSGQWDNAIETICMLGEIANKFSNDKLLNDYKQTANKALKECSVIDQLRLEKLVVLNEGKLLPLVEEGISHSAVLLLKATVEYDRKKDKIVKKQDLPNLSDLLYQSQGESIINDKEQNLSDIDYEEYFNSQKYRDFLLQVEKLAKLVTSDPTVDNDLRALSYMYLGDCRYYRPDKLKEKGYEPDHNKLAYEYYCNSGELGNVDGSCRAAVVCLCEYLVKENSDERLPEWLLEMYSNSNNCFNYSYSKLSEAFRDDPSRNSSRFVYVMMVFKVLKKTGAITEENQDDARKAYLELDRLVGMNWRAAVVYKKNEMTTINKVKNMIDNNILGNL